MTRSTLKKALRLVYVLLAAVLAVSFLAKIADHIPGLAGTGAEKILKDGYEYLRDMSLLIATGGVAYITNMFQKRSSFIDGVAFYQITDKGLMAHADISGTKFWVNDELR